MLVMPPDILDTDTSSFRRSRHPGTTSLHTWLPGGITAHTVSTGVPRQHDGRDMVSMKNTVCVLWNWLLLLHGLWTEVTPCVHNILYNDIS